MRLLIAAFLCFYAATVWAGEYAVEVYVVEKIPSTETKCVPFFSSKEDGDKQVEEWMREAAFSAKFPRLKNRQTAKSILNPESKTLPAKQNVTPLVVELGQSTVVVIQETLDQKLGGEITYRHMVPQSNGAIQDNFVTTKLRDTGRWLVISPSDSSDKTRPQIILIYKVTKL